MFDSETVKREDEGYQENRRDDYDPRGRGGFENDRADDRRERDAYREDDYRDDRRREYADGRDGRRDDRNGDYRDRRDGGYHEERRDGEYRDDYRGGRWEYRESRGRDGDYRDGRRDYREDSYRDVRRDFYEYDEPRGRRESEYDRGYDRRDAGYDSRGRGGFGSDRGDNRSFEDSRGGYDASFQAQMDSFKDKARQLQEIINDKQERVEDLERTLADLDKENQKLQDALEKSRQETGDYAVDIDEQVNRLSELLGKDMGDMEQRISDRIAELPSQMPGEMQEITFDTDALNQSIERQSQQMEKLFSSISDKLEAIINTQKSASNQSFDEVFSDQKSFLSNSMLTQEKKLSESLNGMSRQLDGMKDEISEKIHSEDVKVYRNLQDFIQEQDNSEDEEKKLLKRYKSLRNREYINMVLTVVDIILGIMFLLVIM